MDIVAWLKDLGVEQYATAFADNDIDETVLHTLTGDDLKDLGVSSLGHRKKILAAIAALGPSDASTTPLQEGERRQVTVMFADLTGFTRLSREIDAEDMTTLLGRFFAAVDGAVKRHGGTIDKHIGDCSMAVFGAPIAHTDDAARALRAALKARDAIRALAKETGHPIGVHIGIASGEVVAGAMGSDSHRAYTVTGDTVNLASRLTDAAKNDEIYIAEAVHRDVAGLAVCESIGALDLPGIGTPVMVWRLTNILESAEAGGLATTFVGRHAETQQFLAALSASNETKRGRLLLIRGEPGIGKTRLVEEFRNLARERGFASHAALILDFGAGVGGDALRAIVLSLLDLTAHTDEEARENAASRALSAKSINPGHEAHLRDLLDLPQLPRLRAVYDAMTEAMRTEGRIKVAAAILSAAAARSPLLITIEDAHWADAATLNAIAQLAIESGGCPSVMVVTTRTDGDPLDRAWRARLSGVSVVTIDLAPLEAEESRALAVALGGGSELIERCLTRAEGNPLFLEQLLRNADETTSLPGTIQSVVLARTDRLVLRDKRALQAASVLGQRFEADAVQFLAGDAGYDCDQLVRQYLLRPQGDGVYLFAHALIRDGVYAALLRSRARELHARAAEWYRERDPVLHAEHLARAADPKAPRAYAAAAATQRKAYHNEDALSLLDRGLTIATAREDKFELACLRGDVLVDLGRAADGLRSYEDAIASAVTPAEIARGYFGQASALRLADRLDEAIKSLDKAEAPAQESQLLETLARIRHLRGNLFFPTGRMRECLEEQTAALRLAEAAASDEIKALALGGLGDAEYANGRLLTAHQHFKRCVALAREHGFGRTEVANRSMVSVTRIFCGPLDGALDEIKETIAMAQAVGHQRAAIIALHAAYHYCLWQEDFANAAQYIEAAQDLTQRIGAMRFEAENLAYLADVWRWQDKKNEASDLIERAWVAAEKMGVTYFGPCVLGVMIVAAQDPARQRFALEQGERLLSAPSLVHNKIVFRIYAIEHSINSGDFDAACGHASKLEASLAEETPFTRLIVASARARAAFHRRAIGEEELKAVAVEARAIGFPLMAAPLEAALSST